jgi:hypothetical protein
MKELKYTAHFLAKLENIFAESDYVLRYERGNFQSGYCILKSKKIIVVNKFSDLEGKVNYLAEILQDIPLDTAKMSEKSKELLQSLQQKTA